MTALDDWTDRRRGARRCDLGAADDSELVLDLARDVAHGVMRPAAPLTAYLLGVAVGRGADPVTAAAATVYRRLAEHVSRREPVADRAPAARSSASSSGCWTPSAVDSSGTSTLASGK